MIRYFYWCVPTWARALIQVNRMHLPSDDDDDISIIDCSDIFERGSQLDKSDTWMTSVVAKETNRKTVRSIVLFLLVFYIHSFHVLRLVTDVVAVWRVVASTFERNNNTRRSRRMTLYEYHLSSSLSPFPFKMTCETTDTDTHTHANTKLKMDECFRFNEVHSRRATRKIKKKIIRRAPCFKNVFSFYSLE